MRASSCGLLAVGLFATLISAAGAEPLAARLEGRWNCVSRTDGSSFEWRVARDMAGGWLTGEGIEQGRRLSLDVWAYDNQGRLQTRRQFTPTGAVITMDVTERGSEHLRLEGVLTHRDGRSLRLRERIAFVADHHFDAMWEADEGSGWRIVVDETCRKPG